MNAASRKRRARVRHKEQRKVRELIGAARALCEINEDRYWGFVLWKMKDSRNAKRYAKAILGRANMPQGSLWISANLYAHTTADIGGVTMADLASALASDSWTHAP